MHIRKLLKDSQSPEDFWSPDETFKNDLFDLSTFTEAKQLDNSVSLEPQEKNIDDEDSEGSELGEIRSLLVKELGEDYRKQMEEEDFEDEED